MRTRAGRGAVFAAAGILGLAVALAPGCGGPVPSAEEEIRALIGEAELAAEDRDLSALGEMVSPAYRDAARRDRRELVRLAALYLLRNESIHLLVRVRDIRVDPAGRGEAELYLAAAGRPISDLEALVPLRADLYRVDLVLRRGEDDAWQVTGARWERADRRRIIEELLE
ncbi:MAG: hypothetical protein PVG98_09835 [Chromatiales bacterium]